VIVPVSGGDLDDSDLVAESRFPALARVIELMGQGELLRALDELGVLLDTGDEDLRPRAVLLLGRINEARGNTAQMLHAYEVAAASGHPEVAPFASAVLGGKLLELGQPGPARRALKKAAQASDPQVREAAETALRAMSRPRWQPPWRH
jgi:HEAT repeat protein